MKTASTSVVAAGQRPITIFCAFPREAAAVAERLDGGRRTHYGLFAGYLGSLGGAQAAIAITGAGENAAYTAVRQLAFHFRPSLIAGFGIASAVAEWLREGDVILVDKASRYYCPLALADNMFLSDELIFPSAEARGRVVEAPVAVSDQRSVGAALERLNHACPPGLQQSRVCAVGLGSSDDPLLAWRAREFVRSRYGVEAVDTESYGLLCGASDVGVPALCVKVIGDGCAPGSREEFRRHAKRAVRRGAACLETAVTAAQDLLLGGVPAAR